MSIKNLPLITYLESKGLIRAAVLTEIRSQKEEALKLEVAAYEVQLTEELTANLLAFEQANTPTSDEPAFGAEYEAKREAFLDQLTKEKAQKLEQFANDLAVKLKNEMSYLQNARFSQLALEHAGPLTIPRLDANIQTLLAELNSAPHLFTFLLKANRAKLVELNGFLNKLYINAFVDPLFMLFLARLEGTSLRLHEKFRKVRIRKFKMKRRKVRKLYVFRKLKRVILFRKLKKRYFVKTAYNTPLLSFWVNDRSKNLIRRIPVSTRVIEATAVEFFYKMNKKFNRHLIEDYDLVDEEVTEFLIYLRNYHQKPYFKFRKARMAHWRLFFNKTLRQQRYKGFLRRFMKKYEQLSYTLNFLVNFFTKVKLSWTRCSKLESFLKLYVVEYTHNIVRIPLIFMNFFKWGILRKRSYFLRKKMGRWSYLNFRRATCPWLQKKKNSPKLSYHIQPNLHYFNAISYWDFMTGFLHLEEDLKVHSLPVANQFKANFLTKLHMYRYKPNNVCMLLSITNFI